VSSSRGEPCFVGRYSARGGRAIGTARHRLRACASARRRRKKTSPKPSNWPRTGISVCAVSRAGSPRGVRRGPEQFLKEYETRQRSPVWVEGHGAWLRVYLLLFFGAFGVSEVTPGKVQEYRVHRVTPRRGSRTAHCEQRKARLLISRTFAHSIPNLIGVTSLFLLAWPTLEKLGYSIKSFGGDTVVERLEDFIFRILFLLGTFLGILALA
jgi:hypothetical protein